jgi:hypothetical protein
MHAEKLEKRRRVIDLRSRREALRTQGRAVGGKL